MCLYFPWLYTVPSLNRGLTASLQWCHTKTWVRKRRKSDCFLFFVFLCNDVSKKEIRSGNDGLVEVRMFPKTDGLKRCRRSSAVQRCEAVTDSGDSSAAGRGDRQPPSLLSGTLWALCGWAALLRRCEPWGPSWWEARHAEYPSSASLGCVTKLSHTRERVLCQKVIFLEREEFMWFYQAACPSHVWLCGVARGSTEAADTFSCSLRVIAHKTNDTSPFLGKQNISPMMISFHWPKSSKVFIFLHPCVYCTHVYIHPRLLACD